MSTHAGSEAWPSWLSSLPLCCAPLTSCLDKRQGRIDEKKLYHPVVYDQPFYHPRPVAAPETPTSQQELKEREKPPRRSYASGRSTLSKKRRFWPSTSSTTSAQPRPPISAPSNFRHISTASPHIPDDSPRPPPASRTQAANLRPAKPLRPRSFRPLELSIYQSSDKSISPILPRFEFPNVTPPPPAYVQHQLDEGRPLAHYRSHSSSPSFHLPRKFATDSSPSTGGIEEELPPIIPPKAQGRARALTSPEVVEAMKIRVASAMVEVEKLQRQIDDVIERQSLYVNSRPSTPRSVARTLPDIEPMPSIPALPPAAPSFAERLNSEITRPHTAPIKAPIRTRTPEEVSAALRAPPRIRRDDGPLPPPLPLVLRPPLRKKKSFSRVSSWLFPGAEHNRNLSFDSVTNVPRPVKGNEGFYQVSLGETPGRRRSTESVDTVSTWETDEDRTVPTTTWSPDSTPATKQDDPFISRTAPTQEGPFLSRIATFGKNDVRPKRTSVGVAF